MPPSGADFAPGAEFNSFEVVDGAIVNSTVDFLNTVTVGGFALDWLGVGTATLTNQFTGDDVQSNFDSVSFTPVTAETTPEPTSIITLLGVGVLGVASKLKKKA